MNGASSGVQYWDDTGSGMTFNNVTVKSGTLNYYSNLGTSAIYLEGGTLSPASGTNEIAILKAESIAWDAGKISFNLTEDTAASDKIVLAYALSKTSFSGAGGIREIELSADAYDIAAWIDANDNAPITYTLMEYSSTDMANSDIVFTQIDGITIDWNFGDTALTVTLGLVPEPAEAAAAPRRNRRRARRPPQAQITPIAFTENFRAGKDFPFRRFSFSANRRPQKKRGNNLQYCGECLYSFGFMENAAQNVSGGDDPIIKVRGLRHMYSEGDGTKEVLHGVDLDISAAKSS